MFLRCSWIKSRRCWTTQSCSCSQLQTKLSGLPTVRRFFLCMVNIKADFPWDFLANYRLAKRSEFGMLQLFLGREMLRDATGTVPEMHSGWKAPSFFVKSLVDNKASSINWEWVYVIVRDVTGVPIPRHTVSGFTDNAGYTDVEWLDEVADIGSTILQAWGVDDKDSQEGSFRSVVARHKRFLKMASTLKAAPKDTFLTNEF